ncbi:MAG: DUF4125 family protein [Oscillospiraceae bacterium]|nr:DUF4125 family protein [Oscillospiraceae bacterium]
MDKNETIARIIELEWGMFQTVNPDGSYRAPCQDDRPTFVGMRHGQFESWPQEALDSYLRDLEQAVQSGRNLVREKYIHMMEHTSPASYIRLIGQISAPSPEVSAAADRLTAMLVEQTVPLFEAYPNVAGGGRPLRSSEDPKGVISIETYQRGELLTYSAQTLSILSGYVEELAEKGVSMARIILENSLAHYGFHSLEEAESCVSERKGNR